MFPPELSLDTVANFHLTSEMTSIYTHEPVDDTKNKIQNTVKTAQIFWFLQVRRWSSWTTEDQFTAFDKKDTEWETLNVHVHYSVIRNQHSFYFHCQTVKMFFSLLLLLFITVYMSGEWSRTSYDFNRQSKRRSSRRVVPDGPLQNESFFSRVPVPGEDRLADSFTVSCCFLIHN